MLRQLAAVRTPGLTGPADWINTTGSTWHPAIGVAVVLLVIAFRRWRHLLVFTLCVFFVEIVSSLISGALSRPRPYGVPVIGRWEGYSAPSPAVMTTTFLLVAGVYCLVVPGRPRLVAKAVAAAVIAVFCLSRLYLAVDHPDDVLSGVVLGVAIPVAAFRYFTPDEVFPVVYRRGRTAHVDVTGSRGAAIRQAVHDQLGLTVLGIAPVGLESSAGSTPLRLTVEGDPREYLFGKLYTLGHVRADRWYKLWRTGVADIASGLLRVLAELRPGWTAGGHRQPDPRLRHLGGRADPVRPARSAAFRAPAEPAAAVHADADIHL